MHCLRLPALNLLASTAILAASVSASWADLNLPGECTFPEGVTATSDGTIYVGSMQYGSILRIPADKTEGEIFVQPHDNSLVSTLGVYADEPRGRLIACSADPGIAHTKVGDDSFTGKGGSGIRVFDLATGKAISSVDFPAGGLCNDIAVDSSGAIYATDTFNGRILRSEDGKNIGIWAMGGVLANQPWTINGIDYRSSTNSILVSSQATGQLWEIPVAAEGKPGAITEIKLSRPLNVPDGLRLIDQSTLGVVEAGNGVYSTVSLADGAVNDVATNLASPATVALARGKAWITSAQGGEFWTPDGDCSKAKKPFHLIEVQQR